MVDLSGFPGTTAEDTTSPESLQVKFCDIIIVIKFRRIEWHREFS